MQFSAERWSFGDSFQIQVLSLCLTDPTFLPRYIDVIDHSYFENKDLSTLAYLVLRDFRSKSKVPHRDTVEFLIREHAQTFDPHGEQSLESRLRHFLQYVYDRQCDTAFVTSRMVRFARRQSIKIAINKAIDWLEQDKPGTDDDEVSVSEKIERAVSEACLRGSERDFGYWFHDVALDLPGIIQRSVTYRTKVPTGLPHLDEDLSGGLGAGELGVILGAPNKGKSTMLTYLGLQAAYHFQRQAKKDGSKPKSVIHITLEMSKEATALKYSAAATALRIGECKTGVENYSELMGRQLDFLANRDINIKHFPPGTTTVEEIRWYVSSLAMVDNIVPGLIIVDYADRLKGGDTDPFKYMGKIYDRLISISLDFEAPLWTGCQVRRADSQNTTVSQDGMAESWKKAEAADTIISLNQSPREMENNILRLYTAKVRDGRARDYYWCKFDPDRVAVRELTEAEIKEFCSKNEGADLNDQQPEKFHREGWKSGGGGRSKKAAPRAPKEEPAAPSLPDDDFFANVGSEQP